MVIKPRMRWVWHVARDGRHGKPDGKRPLGRTRHIWEKGR